MTSTTGTTLQRQRIIVQGIVQGVGFRPFVYNQARRRNLTGFVLNDSTGVTIEIEGTPTALKGFLLALQEEKPPLARIDSLVTELLPPLHETVFTIAHSHANVERHALISPDTATCNDCLHELFDPTDRRYHYAFTNCTNCGPRFTIVQDVPYDRDKTTMRVFPMCQACQTEYDDPLNRRFHAQPNACPICGPQARLRTWETSSVEETDPIMSAAQRLAQSAILAIKGLGGYHLACDALDVDAVQRLRQRKHREAKPFALMVPDIATACELCYISKEEASLLQSYRRPIVLLKQRSNNLVAPAVAPNYTTLGIMLPYTPLHHILLHAFAEIVPKNHLPVLVMTSGNLSDEPIAYKDNDAEHRLHTIAEGMLTHNREIHMRCDDSVMHIVAGGEQFYRRSRGYVPEPISLSFELPVPLLACGGHLKNTFCLGKGKQAFVSHHIGDLENLETLTSFREGIEHFKRLFDIFPQAIAYDLHPEYLATKYAIATDIPQQIGVQHHHAHIASVLAEHGITEQVIGIAADGTGYGTDGAIWGCEIMTADLREFERQAHLSYVPLPGGEQAIHQPWRMAAVYLTQAFGESFLNLGIPFVQQLERSKWRPLTQMIQRGINSPPTSSLGRLFDAVAALLGIHDHVLYEGQAAIEMEMIADTDQRDTYTYPVAIHEGSPETLNVASTIQAIVNDMIHGVPVPLIVARFHRTIATLLAQACMRVATRTGLHFVVLSGGVFQNRLLLEQLQTQLETMSFQVLINRRVPPNDGGISLGQMVVAAARLQQR